MASIELASWILHRHSQPVTHLALQKLVFYCFGASLAFDQESHIGAVPFEPWQHGPVNREVWERCRGYGREFISARAFTPTTPVYSAAVESTLKDVLAVYGSLDAWSLREQSHLEGPWITARQRGESEIDVHSLKAHFTDKLRGPAVVPPEYFLRAGVYAVDGLPAPRFDSFRALADAARRSRSAA